MKNEYGLGKKYKRSWSGLIYLTFTMLLSLVAMGYATQNTAELYGYHKALGPTAYKQFYWPWMIFFWFQKLEPNKLLNDIISIAQLIFIGPLVLVWLMIFGT